jgi:hypothetical protein
MCSMHIDESSIHVSIATWSSHLCVLFSEKLDSLFDRLDARCTVLEMNHLNVGAKTETAPITVAARCFTTINIPFSLHG